MAKINLKKHIEEYKINKEVLEQRLQVTRPTLLRMLKNPSEQEYRQIIEAIIEIGKEIAFVYKQNVIEANNINNIQNSFNLNSGNDKIIIQSLTDKIRKLESELKRLKDSKN